MEFLDEAFLEEDGEDIEAVMQCSKKREETSTNQQWHRVEEVECAAREAENSLLSQYKVSSKYRGIRMILTFSLQLLSTGISIIMQDHLM